MSVRVTHTVDALDRDMRKIPRRAATGVAKVIRSNLIEGNRRAKAYAKTSARRHGKHYSRSFTWEMLSRTSGEYGPDESRKQGGMSFEGGSKNQKPHKDLERSAGGIGFKFQHDIGDMVDDLFWN